LLRTSRAHGIAAPLLFFLLSHTEAVVQTRDDADSIDLDEAFHRLGTLLFESEWIQKLSHKEEWLLVRQEPTPIRSQPSDLLVQPSAHGYFGKVGSGLATILVYRRWHDPNLEAALDRKEFMHHQSEKVGQWLGRNRIVPGAVGSRSQFDAAVASEFPKSAKPAASVPPIPSEPSGNKRFPDDKLVAEVAEAKRRGLFRSYRAAAIARVEEIGGFGTEDSRIRRIADKARKWTPGD
jgi:hypothetical protein